MRRRLLELLKQHNDPGGDAQPCGGVTTKPLPQAGPVAAQRRLRVLRRHGLVACGRDTLTRGATAPRPLPPSAGEVEKKNSAYFPGLSKPCGSARRLKLSKSASTCLCPAPSSSVNTCGSAMDTPWARCAAMIVVEPLLGGEPHDRQAARRDLAADAQELQMRNQFVAEQSRRSRRRCPAGARPGCRACRYVHAAVALQHLQRRVVPGEFIKRHVARRLGAGLFEGDRAAGMPAGQQRFEGGNRRIRRPSRSGSPARPDNARGSGGTLPASARRSASPASSRSRPPAPPHSRNRTASMKFGKRDDQVDPVPRRRQRHSSAVIRPGRAVGMVDRLCLGLAQFQARGVRPPS